ncbi:MAG: hypothetical protein ACLRFI_03100 [Alphaproteobacteria bacterium]
MHATNQNILQRISHLVYAETYGVSLRVVEALTSMIHNAHLKTGKSIEDIISDKEMFESLNTNSSHNWALEINEKNKAYQMCLRVANRMLKNSLPDMCNGATKFHRYEFMPHWSIARGYIADIDGLLFYL